MHALTELVFRDMKPALGVTEPGAVAFCAARARSLAGGELRHLRLSMNSGMYKNAYTCGIPNSAFVGAAHAAALGYIAGDPEKGLEALENVTEENDREARRLVDEGRVTTEISGVHGINGLSPEDTMRNMGRIADPGMIETEKTILGIQAEKRV